jgi:hypothetical protein
VLEVASGAAVGMAGWLEVPELLSREVAALQTMEKMRISVNIK